MPALDIYHQAVKNALVKDGWTITHDPLHLRVGVRNLFVDLGAERLIAADKGSQKIAVEIKTFTGKSDINDLEHAMGQFVLYQKFLRQTEPDRTLYIAVPIDILNSLFQEVVGQAAREIALTHLFAYDPDIDEIIRWLPETET